MIKFIKKFRKEEDGAVTVDWVVLTAAVVGLAIAAFGSIKSNTETVSDNISSTVLTKGNEFLGTGGGTGG